MIIKMSQARRTQKKDVAMWIYDTASALPEASVVLQKTGKGHGEEFYHDKSFFVYFILEGEGTWVIEGVEYPVEPMDLVIVPPGNRFYYRGNLKHLCITAPAWVPDFEHHVRDVEL